jgi:uncharacterized membrane protein YiaA
MRLQRTAFGLFVMGAIMFVYGIILGNGHSYDRTGYYLDPATGITHSEQTTEIFQIVGVLLLAAGILMYIRVRVKAAH